MELTRFCKETGRLVKENLIPLKPHGLDISSTYGRKERDVYIEKDGELLAHLRHKLQDNFSDTDDWLLWIECYSSDFNLCKRLLEYANGWEDLEEAGGKKINSKSHIYEKHEVI